MYFTEKLLHPDGVGQLDYVFNQSVMGSLARLAAPGDPNRVIWVLLVLAIGGYGLWRAAGRPGRRRGGRADAHRHRGQSGQPGDLGPPHPVVRTGDVVLVDRGWPAPADAGSPLAPAGLDGMASRPGARVLAVVTYATVTYSVLSLWAYSLHEPGGVLGFVMTNWLIWLMLALLVLLPARPSVAVAATPAQVAVET